MKLLFFFLPVILSSCATSEKGTLMGAGLGAGMGAGIGALASPGPKGEGRIRNVFIGAAAGSLVGAGVGYLTHEAISRKENDAYEKGKGDVKKSPPDYTGDAGQPVLIPARVEAKFVDDQVRGSVYIPAHVEYYIAEPAKWSH